MVTNLATAVTTLLFNLVMMRSYGEDGVAAITIVLYVQFLLTAVYLGYATGVAPVFSYKYGEGDRAQIHSLFGISLRFILLSSLLTFLFAQLCASPIVGAFAPRDNPAFALGLHGFHLFAWSFLITGLNIFASALFTAFSNGLISAILSFLRTFVFIVLGILLLPYAWGMNGVWLAIPLAEAISALVSVGFLYRKRHVYGYARAARAR